MGKRRFEAIYRRHAQIALKTFFLEARRAPDGELLSQARTLFLQYINNLRCTIRHIPAEYRKASLGILTEAASDMRVELANLRTLKNWG